MRQRKLFFVGLLAVMLVVLAYALYSNYDWPVPESAQKLVNPVAPSPAALAAARAVYRDKCADCHGESGKGDGPEAASHYPSPPSFLDAARMKSRSDGALFYRISKGRRPMPSFERRLSEEQRWELVLLVRSFAKASPAAH